MKRDGCLRRGKPSYGSAITGVMKLGGVFTQHVTGAEGKPPRDPEPRVGKDSTSPARPSRRVAPARRRAGSRCRSRTRRLRTTARGEAGGAWRSRWPGVLNDGLAQTRPYPSRS